MSGVIIRARSGGLNFRAAPTPDADGLRTLYGHFAVFDQWSEIDSVREGHFMERVAPGAFAMTFVTDRDRIRVLFQHGRDPQIGDKPLGGIQSLREDDIGGSYSVPLLDTNYNRELIPGLEAGLYGASFRFRVRRENWISKPARSDYNPARLPERTIREAQVYEFGPVTFPAYAEATAGVRSLTDWYEAAEIELINTVNMSC
jgi:HK97 family phage prohead protease